MNVTLRDLARAAGVSASTVSRVLRNSPKVHPASRNKVVWAVKELGYRHNPLVDAWATRFRETHRQSGLVLAHVTGFSPEELSANPVLKRVVGAIHSRANELELSISPFLLQDNGVLGASRLRNILFYRGITAVIWGPFPSSAAICVSKEWDFSMVGVGISRATEPLHRAAHNRYRSMRCLSKYLNKFRRPGLVGFGPKESSSSLGWTQAYFHYLAGLPAKNRVPWLPVPAFDRVVISKWLERYRPDVIISPILECRELARETGSEFCALNLVEESANGTIKGITHPSSAIGRGAVDMLLAQCDWNEIGVPTHPRQTTWEGSVVGFGPNGEVEAIPRFMPGSVPGVR